MAGCLLLFWLLQLFALSGIPDAEDLPRGKRFGAMFRYQPSLPCFFWWVALFAKSSTSYDYFLHGFKGELATAAARADAAEVA